ncbi:DUF3500 domain-containing protein [Streptomyces sp. NPDC005876]|uniref:DUF3500 domain-containing protein n=1 Tax=Streptomyces sp. NPDC005876 TaxID=3157076 RepID=UPI00340FB812
MVNTTHGHMPRTRAVHRSRRRFPAAPAASTGPSVLPAGGGHGQATARDGAVGGGTDGTAPGERYALHSSGVATTAVVRAALAFLDSLAPGDRAAALLDADARRRRVRAGAGPDDGHGLALRDLTGQQYALGATLLKAALTAPGLERATGIPGLDRLLGRTGRALAEDAYRLTILGTPSTAEAWGFRLTGRRLVLGYSVLGDQVVMTPAVQDPGAPDTPYDGDRRPLRREETAGLRLLRSLDTAQLAAALRTGGKGGTGPIAGAGPDDVPGVRGADLDHRQRRLLLDLAEAHLGGRGEGSGRARMREIERHLDDTYFHCAGTYGDGSAFTYRVQSPVVRIAYDAAFPLAYHRRPDGATPAGAAGPAAGTPAGARPPGAHLATGG